jgi:excisionase family DNA binding protein
MTITLSPSWQLTDEHSQSSYGIPVLINRGTDDVYGPADIIQPYPSWGYMPAANAVARLMDIGERTDEERVFAARFQAAMPPVDDLINTDEAAKIVGYDRDHLIRLAREGKITGRKIGRNWVFRRVDMESNKRKRKS